MKQKQNEVEKFETVTPPTVFFFCYFLFSQRLSPSESKIKMLKLRWLSTGWSSDRRSLKHHGMLQFLMFEWPDSAPCTISAANCELPWIRKHLTRKSGFFVWTAKVRASTLGTDQSPDSWVSLPTLRSPLIYWSHCVHPLSPSAKLCSDNFGDEAGKPDLRWFHWIMILELEATER